MKDIIIKNIRNLKNFSIFLVSIGINLTSNFLYDFFTAKNVLPKNLLIRYALIVITFLIAVYIFNKISDYFIKLLLPEIPEKQNLIYAFQLVKKVVSNEQTQIINMNSFNLDDLASLSFEKIQDLIEACYQLFESRYSSSESDANGINFEVTFMTKSYIDKEITIPTFCNKERRSPTSMHRRNTNKKIYDNTVTAFVYREAKNSKPQIHIVENTEDEEYNEIYPQQKKRIKSSIIFPVLSPSNDLMGTIVVHCDRANFFLKKKERFWKEILEIFSVQIGREKIILDKANESLTSKTF